MTRIFTKFVTTFFLSASLLCSTFEPSQAAVYKHIDENGQVVYSDKPAEGAEKLKIKRHPKYGTTGGQAQKGQAQDLPPAPEVYEGFEILTPKEGKNIESSTGNVEVVLLVSPKLHENHKIIYYLNGKNVSNGRHISISLRQLSNGPHTVSASIVNTDNSTVQQTKSVTFHVARATSDRNKHATYDN